MARSPLAPKPADQGPVPGDGSVQSLFDEIEQEVKAKQFTDFMKKYGKSVAGVLFAVVLGTTIASAWSNIQHTRQAEDSEKLIALLDREPASFSDAELKEALKDYVALGESGAGEGHREIARLAEAGVLAARGEKQTAATRLKEMQGDLSIRPIYRDYALLSEVRMRMDSDKASEMQEALKPLLDPKNAWYLSALELSAVLFAKEGKYQDAMAQLQGIISTEDAPLAAKERANQLARLYSAK
jgi:hypothetical protein